MFLCSSVVNLGSVFLGVICSVFLVCVCFLGLFLFSLLACRPESFTVGEELTFDDHHFVCFFFFIL